MPEQAEPRYPLPPRRPEDPRSKRRRRFSALTSKNHAWSGRPLTLAIGWIMSCALVTAVTLTAVNRVGHEVSGNQPPVLSSNGVEQAVAEQSSSAAAASSASATATNTASPSPTAVPSTPNQTPRTTSQQVSTPPAGTTPPPPPPSSVTSSSAPPPVLSSSPPPSDLTSPAASPSPSPSPVPSSGASFPVPKDADPLSQYGWIKIVCTGDSINATAQPLNGYLVSKVDAPASEADFQFTKGSFQTEYVYTCTNGVISGGVVLHERP